MVLCGWSREAPLTLVVDDEVSDKIMFIAADPSARYGITKLPLNAEQLISSKPSYIYFIFVFLNTYRRSAMAEPSKNENMADAAKDAALPTPPATPVPLPKKFPKGVVLGKDGKP